MNLRSNTTMTKHELDATNQSLGRLASKAALLLRGKDKPTYIPNELPDNEVVVKNLKEAKFTGNKLAKKLYHHYSGYHSGIKTQTLGQLWDKDPEEVLRQMIYTMLPTNRTRDKIIRNLKFN